MALPIQIPTNLPDLGACSWCGEIAPTHTPEHCPPKRHQEARNAIADLAFKVEELYRNHMQGNAPAIEIHVNVNYPDPRPADPRELLRK